MFWGCFATFSDVCCVHVNMCMCHTEKKTQTSNTIFFIPYILISSNVAKKGNIKYEILRCTHSWYWYSTTIWLNSDISSAKPALCDVIGLRPRCRSSGGLSPQETHGFHRFLPNRVNVNKKLLKMAIEIYSWFTHENSMVLSIVIVNVYQRVSKWFFQICFL